MAQDTRSHIHPGGGRRPLARTPYDLRHARISTLLALGISPAQVAEWAGNSVEVIYKVYAKVIHSGQASVLDQIRKSWR